MAFEEDCWNAFVERAHISGADNGVLAGLNFAVKDNIGIEGRTFSAGHPLLATRRAASTAPCIELLLDAGANCVGMTQTDAVDLASQRRKHSTQKLQILSSEVRPVARLQPSPLATAISQSGLILGGVSACRLPAPV